MPYRIDEQDCVYVFNGSGLRVEVDEQFIAVRPPIEGSTYRSKSEKCEKSMASVSGRQITDEIRRT